MTGMVDRGLTMQTCRSRPSRAGGMADDLAALGCAAAPAAGPAGRSLLIEAGKRVFAEGPSSKETAEGPTGEASTVQWCSAGPGGTVHGGLLHGPHRCQLRLRGRQQSTTTSLIIEICQAEVFDPRTRQASRQET